MQNLDRFKFRVFEKDSGIFYPDQDSLYAYLSGKYPDSIVMQCTGLKDKNSDLIFEGDIVQFRSEVSGKKIIAKVIWYSTQWVCENHQGDSISFFGGLNIAMGFRPEIIGNLYENPELLESI